MPDDLELVYIGDPMCSWCWGFAPVLHGLEERLDLPLRVVAGGLAAGDGARVVDDAMAEFIAHHWHQVEENTGQPFDHATLKRRGWVYDTELPCRAVVAMRELAPEHALAFFSRVQRAFYAEGVDVTDPAAYPALAAEFPVDGGAFMALLVSGDVRDTTRADFIWARHLGVSSFPTLIIRDGEKGVLVARGWAPLDKVEARIRHWLDAREPTVEAGDACDVDTGVC